MNKVGEVKWRSENEDGTKESVVSLKFGIDGFFYHELLVAEIAESASAVGFPRHGDVVADAEVFGFYELRQHWVRSVLLIEMFKIVVPIHEAEIFGEDDQGAVSDSSDAFEISPKAFQCGCT